jgi:hypothetical protein
VEIDFSQVSHSFRPQFLKAIRELLRELSVSHQEGSNPSFGNKRMIQGQNYDVVIHDVKGVAEFP